MKADPELDELVHHLILGRTPFPSHDFEGRSLVHDIVVGRSPYASHDLEGCSRAVHHQPPGAVIVAQQECVTRSACAIHLNGNHVLA